MLGSGHLLKKNSVIDVVYMMSKESGVLKKRHPLFVFTGYRAPVFRLLLALFIAGVMGPASWAGPVHFTVESAGEIRTASADTADVQGTAYLSLSALSTQAGGNFRLMPARVQIDLGGYTAIAGINDTRVSASQSQFSLQHPIVLRDNDALIALEDVSSFFRQAFQVSVEQELDTALQLDVSAPPIDSPETPEAPPILDAAAPPLERMDAEPESPPGDTEETAEAPPAETSPTPDMAPPPSLRGAAPVIIIDPGHGGSDLGYVGASGLVEKDLVLAVAQQLRRLLKEQSKARIFMTRQDDGELRIESRRKFAGQNEANLIVSLHAGASFSPQAHGIEFFIPAASASGVAADASALRESRRVADALALALSPVAESRGVREAPLRLLSGLSTPGVLIEIGFLSNPAEETLLATEEHQLKIAQGIATGIVRAMGGELP